MHEDHEPADLEYAREWADKIMAMLCDSTWYVHSETIGVGSCDDCYRQRVLYRVTWRLDLCWDCASSRARANPDKPSLHDRLDVAIAKNRAELGCGEVAA